MSENDIQSKGLKLKKNYYAPAPETETDLLEKQAKLQASSGKPLRRGRDFSKIGRYLLNTLGALVLMGLTAGLLYARFISCPPWLAPDLLKKYGMIAVGVVYFVAITLALKDNMFDGLLAIIIPFYPFYYLFFVAGSILLRALGAMLLVVFGWDCLLLLQKMSLQIFDRISYWINNV